MDTAKTFFYNANGCALGGEIRWPISQTLDPVAATSLPITGGYGSAKAGEYKLQDIIGYKSASGEVSGKRDELDGAHNTEITATIEGLNINNVVTADRIVARLSSKCKPDDTEGCIVAAGSEFVNLQIAGYPVEVELDLSLFANLDTQDKFKKKYQDDPDFRKTAQKRFLWDDVDGNAPEWLKQRYKWVTPRGALPESKGIIPCSLIKSIKCACPDVQIYGNVIIVANFGTIFLGEILMKENSRRLTMMRLAMGSPVGGDVTVAGIEGNGTLYP
ncbi:MAG TPA: choice-of-anchor P family protein [Clostridia bacterium]|nr:choice-of-anchor P family protein [Clostridia bacterium]